jgi:adenylate cyclase class 2
MDTEIEAKFLDIDLDEFRERLREAGATQVQPERLMKRAIYDYPDKRLDVIGGWVRLRDEGDKTTLSYKQQGERTLHGTQEVSVIVDDFAATAAFLESIGLEQKSYQENRRESWTLDGVEIELDTWPWAPSYVEIEAKTEPRLHAVANKLNLKMSQAAYGSVEIVYTSHFSVDEDSFLALPSVTFDRPLPSSFKLRSPADEWE